MADLLNIGLSGLAANKTSLAVTGHNIVNVNTPGEIVRAVNQVGAAPSDLMAILEALKQAGALQADLIVI
ncbi:hypothetical protein N619_19625 [Ectopseudomonas oleovorans]|nr:hypothetical protein N619_19625 [Pseudomonas oleovorans]